MEGPIRESRPRRIHFAARAACGSNQHRLPQSWSQRKMASPHRRSRLQRRSAGSPSRMRLRRSRWRRPNRYRRHRSRRRRRDLDEPQPQLRPLARHCLAGNQKQPRRYRSSDQSRLEARRAIQPHDHQRRLCLVKLWPRTLWLRPRYPCRPHRDPLALRHSSIIAKCRGRSNLESDRASTLNSHSSVIPRVLCGESVLALFTSLQLQLSAPTALSVASANRHLDRSAYTSNNSSNAAKRPHNRPFARVSLPIIAPHWARCAADRSPAPSPRSPVPHRSSPAGILQEQCNTTAGEYPPDPAPALFRSDPPPRPISAPAPPSQPAARTAGRTSDPPLPQASPFAATLPRMSDQSPPPSLDRARRPQHCSPAIRRAPFRKLSLPSAEQRSSSCSLPSRRRGFPARG